MKLFNIELTFFPLNKIFAIKMLFAESKYVPIFFVIITLFFYSVATDELTDEEGDNSAVISNGLPKLNMGALKLNNHVVSIHSNLSSTNTHPRRRLARSYREIGSARKCSFYPGLKVNVAACGICRFFVPESQSDSFVQCSQCIVCAKGWKKITRRSIGADESSTCTFSEIDGKTTCKKCMEIEDDNSEEMEDCRKCTECTD